MTQYVAQGEIYRDQFLNQLCDQNATWKLEKEWNGIKVSSRIIPGCSKTDDAAVFRSEVLLDVAPRKLFIILDPREKYRPQWDMFVDKIEVDEIYENFAVIHHAGKSALAGLVSARDSIDICSFGKVTDSENDYYIVAGSIESHPDYPPTLKYVRIFMYPTGYRIYPVEDEPNKSKFVMFFNSDLKMNRVASMMAEKIKPGLMIEKAENVRKWIGNVDNKNVIEML